MSVQSRHCILAPVIAQKKKKKERVGSDKEGKNECGESGEIKCTEGEIQASSYKWGENERGVDVMANHFPPGGVRNSVSVSSSEQSRELFANTPAPRQRLVLGWHAAVAGCVGVTSALGPGGLKTQGCWSGEEGHSGALTHCGNQAASAIWGPSDGEAYLEMLTESPLRNWWKGKKKSPQPSVTYSPLFCCFVCFVPASFPWHLMK